MHEIELLDVHVNAVVHTHTNCEVGVLAYQLLHSPVLYLH